MVSAALVLAAAIALGIARAREVLLGTAALLLLSVVVWIVFRYPKRLIFKASASLLGVLYLATVIALFHAAVRPPHLLWSIAGAVSSVAILGSINLAMLLGHWYLVVRGMPIDPLKRLTIATLVSTVLKIALVTVVLLLASGGFSHGSAGYRITVSQGIFFWMRVGWGLLAPLALYPLIWGTVRIRSTMAATGILYVDVVAVVIGEVLGIYLSSLERLPL
jgi:hypothetical protein